jgi:putative amino-acid transport system substrate-binding protein
MTDRLTIAIDRLNPPFTVVEDGLPAGYSVDVICAALAHEGIEAEFLPVDGPMAQTIWLAAGRADAAADITVTERRRAWFAFSAHYHVEELMIFGLRHGPIWPGFRHFTGKLAVKVNSYVHEYLIRHHPHIPLVTVDSTEAELDELIAGRVQGMAATRETGLALIASGRAPDVIAEGVPFGPAPLSLAARPDDTERVIAPFDAGLAALSRGGELDRLRARWAIGGGQ